MSAKIQMKAQKREGTGKGTARALRRENKIPAVIYGDNKAPYTIVLDAKEINMEYNKGHMFTTLVEMDTDGEKSLVLARDIQLHPVTDFVLHADFLRVTAKTKIAVMVPVHMVDEDKCPALEQNGILNIVRHEVELMCTATSIPESIEVSLAGKELHDSVKMSDAKLPEGVTPVIDDRDFTIATLVEPRSAAEEEAAEEEAMEDAETEVIGEEGEEASAEGEEEKSE